METIWVIVIASLAAINCSLLGTYLVLRKITMAGDAISHAVLPGIVLSFLLTGSKTSLVVLVGASGVGILATSLMAFLHRRMRLKSDAAIGINCTWLFALGVILISFFSNKIDLDPDCILYGEIAYAPLDTWVGPRGIDLGPRAVYILVLVLLLNVSFVLLGYKELSVTTFDPDFATTIGLSANLWHYLLMGAVSFTTVATFEVVGAILVVALLVAPSATAYLLAAQHLHTMLLVAILLSVLTAMVGYYLAIWVNGSIAGAMATTSGSFFLLAFFAQQLRRRSSILQPRV